MQFSQGCSSTNWVNIKQPRGKMEASFASQVNPAHLSMVEQMAWQSSGVAMFIVVASRFVSFQVIEDWRQEGYGSEGLHA